MEGKPLCRLPLSAKTGEWNSVIEQARYVHFLRHDGVELAGRHRLSAAGYSRYQPAASVRLPTGNMDETISRMLWQPGVDFDIARFNGGLALEDSIRLVGWPGTLSLARGAAILRFEARVLTPRMDPTSFPW